MAQIVVSGYMVRLPLVGNMLAFAQYLLGLRLLGHRVLFVEESGWPDSCYNPVSKSYSCDPTIGLQAGRTLLKNIGCDCPIAFVDSHRSKAYGIEITELKHFIANADLVLNVGGVCWLDYFEDAPRIALVDMDPLFTQAGSFAKHGLDKYTSCFTYGTNIGQDGCLIPQADIDWQPTMPPVVPELWRTSNASDVEEGAVFTTIANWSAYGSIEWQGEHYGQKDEQFLNILELPKLVRPKLRLAVSGMPRAVASRFVAAGWEIIKAETLSGTFDDYRSFIICSSGELSVAKHGYVKARTGWVSDRTVCYLAAGRPAVVQDTGVPQSLGECCGWMHFTNVSEAAALLNDVMSNYKECRQQASALAYSTFSYDKVLPDLLDRALG